MNLLEQTILDEYRKELESIDLDGELVEKALKKATDIDLVLFMAICKVVRKLDDMEERLCTVEWNARREARF